MDDLGAVLTDQQDPQVGDDADVVSETLSNSVSTLCPVGLCFWNGLLVAPYGFRNHLQSGHI